MRTAQSYLDEDTPDGRPRLRSVIGQRETSNISDYCEIKARLKKAIHEDVKLSRPGLSSPGRRALQV